jgi:hypothetical protein
MEPDAPVSNTTCFLIIVYQFYIVQSIYDFSGFRRIFIILRN